MSIALSSPARALRELLSAAASDRKLRLRLKASARTELQAWGVDAPDRTVYFVEPGQTPPEVRAGEVFIEMPAPAPSLDDDSLDAVAGGWDQARDVALLAVDRAVGAADWQASDGWRASDPWA